jgi:hypothetical protein
MAKDFSVSLSTGPAWVFVEELQGLATDGRSIFIAPKHCPTKNYMDTVVHETLHLSLPGLSEEEVARIAGDITEVLWKRGYRLPKKAL